MMVENFGDDGEARRTRSREIGGKRQFCRYAATRG